MPSTLGPLVGMILQEWNAALGQVIPRLDQATSSRFLWNRKTETVFEIEICSQNLLKTLDQGEVVFVFLAEVIREDGQTFFGFQSLSERDLFLELKEIDAIGNKTAALALRSLGVTGLRQLSAHGVATVGKVPGLGPKTLEKLKQGIQSKKIEFETLFSAVLKSSQILKVQPLADSSNVSENDSENKIFATLEMQAESHKGDLPQVVVQALIKLGIPGPDIFLLFEKIQKEELSVDPSQIKNRTSAEWVKKILSQWSRVRQKSPFEKGI
jgi:Holliday junction resolvasome RuvABC DNA-binding subunit